jgi:hypothetical protein
LILVLGRLAAGIVGAGVEFDNEVAFADGVAAGSLSERGVTGWASGCNGSIETLTCHRARICQITHKKAKATITVADACKWTFFIILSDNYMKYSEVVCCL